MKSIACALLITVVLSCGNFAMAEMFLQGVGSDHAMSATHDRFYSGEDKAFIGAALDLSGVGQVSNGTWATMISPQYFITAWHYHYPTTPATVTFYEGNTTASGGHTYAVDTGFSFTTSYGGQSSDVYMGRLSEPIPAADHIAYYPVLTLPNYSDYVGRMIYNYGVPNRLGRNVISSIAPYAEGTENEIGMFFNYDVPGLGADETYLMGGDSGGPSFAVVNGNLSLLGEHFSNWGTSGLPGAPGNVTPTSGDGFWWSVDGFLPAYIDQINSVLPADQQITTVVPEPATLSVLALGALALLRRREQAK